MRNVLTTRSRRLASASIVALIAMLSLGAWMLLSDPVASNAAPNSNTGSDVSTATAGLEALHQRTMARTASEDDDDKPSSPGGRHAITPEQAAMLAHQVALAHGDAMPKHNYIELQTRNGRPVYAVRMAAGSVYIDADTAAVGN